jgi:hypothetical protein
VGELKRFELDISIAHIVVCCHEPPYSNGKVVPPNTKVRTFFAEPFQRSVKTSLFFSGHSHTYERFLKEGKTFIVSGGGGGPRHDVNTDTASQSEPEQYKGPERRFFHFCEITLQGHDLLVRVSALFKNNELENVETFLIRGQTN